MSLKYIPPRKMHFKGDKKNISAGLPEDMITFYKGLAEESGKTFTDIITDVLDQVGEQIEMDVKNRKKKSSL